MDDVFTQLNRVQRSARMGFLWPGTSLFHPPRQFHWKGHQWTLKVPEEKSLSWVFKDVIIDDEYGLEKIVYRPKTILDIGANVGIFSVWAAANFPGVTIHAYEPNTALKGFLDTNLIQASAQAFYEGVSGEDGWGTFVPQGESMSGQCSTTNNGDIPMVSLRTAIERIGGTVDLLKLDCEGAEWSIFSNPESFKNIKSVRMEYHLIQQDQTLQRLIDTFNIMGFHLIDKKPNSNFGIAWFER
jgi:FkbM family methyltransferase